MKYKMWLAREVERLTAIYPRQSIEQTCADMGRSKPSIKSMAKKLGLRRDFSAA